MSTPKRYGSISLAESTACEAAFERMEVAWKSGDLEQISEALAGLSSEFVYSNYPWYRRWDELKPQVVQALWRGWTRERFWKIEGHKNLSLWEFREALEPLASEFSESDLRELCQRCGFPVAHRQPQLWARLVEEPSEEFSRWLVARVEADLSDEGRLQATKTHKSKTPFCVFHWQPFKPDVAAPVGILARRRDRVAYNQTRQWLHEIPFSSDRASVQALLGGAFDNPYPELQDDLENALERFSSPTDLRLVLFERLVKIHIKAGLVAFFTDLRLPMKEEAQEAYLQFMDQHLPDWKARNESVLRDQMQLVDCKKWSAFMRGYWASVAEQNHMTSFCKVSLSARLIDWTVRAFDDTRPYIWGGCLMGWPLFLFLGFIIQTVMTLVWGQPPHKWMVFNWTLTIVWATYVAATAMFDIYHGGEARRTRFKMALFSFGSLAAMLIVGVWSRNM